MTTFSNDAEVYLGYIALLEGVPYEEVREEFMEIDRVEAFDMLQADNPGDLEHPYDVCSLFERRLGVRAFPLDGGERYLVGIPDEDEPCGGSF